MSRLKRQFLALLISIGSLSILPQIASAQAIQICVNGSGTTPAAYFVCFDPPPGGHCEGPIYHGTTSQLIQVVQGSTLLACIWSFGNPLMPTCAPENGPPWTFIASEPGVYSLSYDGTTMTAQILEGESCPNQ